MVRPISSAMPPIAFLRLHLIRTTSENSTDNSRRMCDEIVVCLDSEHIALLDLDWRVALAHAANGRPAAGLLALAAVLGPRLAQQLAVVLQHDGLAAVVQVAAHVEDVTGHLHRHRGAVAVKLRLALLRV